MTPDYTRWYRLIYGIQGPSDCEELNFKTQNIEIFYKQMTNFSHLLILFALNLLVVYTYVIKRLTK